MRVSGSVMPGAAGTILPRHIKQAQGDMAENVTEAGVGLPRTFRHDPASPVMSNMDRSDGVATGHSLFGCPMSVWRWPGRQASSRPRAGPPPPGDASLGVAGAAGAQTGPCCLPAAPPRPHSFFSVTPVQPVRPAGSGEPAPTAPSRGTRAPPPALRGRQTEWPRAGAVLCIDAATTWGGAIRPRPPTDQPGLPDQADQRRGTTPVNADKLLLILILIPNAIT